MSAIEVLKARALPIEKIADAYLFGKEVHKGKMFVQVDWIDYDLKEAIVALEKQENYVIDFIRLEVLPKSKKEQFRVFFKDGTEQVFQMERVGEQK